MLRAQLIADPLREQDILDLACGEGIGEVADETDGQLVDRLGLLTVRKASLDELKDMGDVREQQCHCVRGS